MSEPILHIDGRVHYQINGATLVDTGRAERIENWRLERGEVAVLTGVSGAGKSTLLSIFAGIASAQSGRIFVAGQDWDSMHESARDRYRAKTIGYLPQREHLLPSLSVEDNVVLPAYFLRGVVRSADRERARALLKSLDVSKNRDAPIHTLSQGQAQRVCLARALMNAPALVLADEPSANLDDDSTQRVADLLATHASEANAALVIATHDSRLRAALPTAQIWALFPC